MQTHSRIAVAGATGGVGRHPEGSCLTVLDELSGVLSAVSHNQMSKAAAMLEDRQRRWFFCGQGRSGLAAQMAAMRLMHVGFTTHVVGETTAPAVVQGDGLVAISATGETPLTLYLARLARDLGAEVLAVTSRGDSTLAGVAQTRIELPISGTEQFGGTLFEQSALLVLDALVLDITADEPRAYAFMQTRHANLQ
jgi:6-phospho-3-hexuloisomerase